MMCMDRILYIDCIWTEYMYIAIYIVFGIIKYSENNINVEHVKI
jgi:hypothetical protein